MFDGYQVNEQSGAVNNEAGLLSKYAYLVKRAVAHLNGNVSASVSQEDLEQIGLMGLLEAIRRYGVPDEGFENFAFTRIRGSILDELRRQDWRPRGVRQAANKLNHIRRELTKKLGRDPTETELAQKTGLGIEKVRELIYADHAQSMESLENWLSNGGEKAEASELTRQDKQVMLSRALGHMTKRERLLVSLYYQQGLNLKEIGLALDLAPSRVCQLHKECLETLNKLLRETQ